MRRARARKGSAADSLPDDAIVARISTAVARSRGPRRGPARAGGTAARTEASASSDRARLHAKRGRKEPTTSLSNSARVDLTPTLRFNRCLPRRGEKHPLRALGERVRVRGRIREQASSRRSASTLRVKGTEWRSFASDQVRVGYVCFRARLPVRRRRRGRLRAAASSATVVLEHLASQLVALLLRAPSDTRRRAAKRGRSVAAARPHTRFGKPRRRPLVSMIMHGSTRRSPTRFVHRYAWVRRSSACRRNPTLRSWSRAFAQGRHMPENAHDVPARHQLGRGKKRCRGGRAYGGWRPSVRREASEAKRERRAPPFLNAGPHRADTSCSNVVLDRMGG